MTLPGRLEKNIYDYRAYKSEVTIPVLTMEPFEIREDRNMDFAPSVFFENDLFLFGRCRPS